MILHPIFFDASINSSFFSGLPLAKEFKTFTTPLEGQNLVLE